VTAAATPAIDLVARSGIDYRLHAYASPERHARGRDRRPSYGSDAALALGLDPARVFKTLVASVDGEVVLAVVPVDRELDLKRLALARSGRKATLVDPVAAQRSTGGVIGGISPLGSRRPLPVVVDASASGHQTVFVSAGRRGLELELAPADLVRLCSALLAPVARDDGPG
jgi:Cys-tRNA(Pro)/Cys-tRNA(Cys) deacylase